MARQDENRKQKPVLQEIQKSQQCRSNFPPRSISAAKFS
jgi:hypothetical protein